jgi:hypothetical protein
MERFSKNGRLIIPLQVKKSTSRNIDQVRFIVTNAFCPEGCSLIDKTHKINNYLGLRIKYRRLETEGEFIISAIEGDFQKIVLSGTLENGVKLDLFCPHCDIPLVKLVNCNCRTDADMVIVGLTERLDFNNAITFCNVTGCEKGSFVMAGKVIRHIRLNGHTFF